MNSITNWTSRNIRFLFSLIPAVVIIIGTLTVIGLITMRLEGVIGLTIGIIAGGCLALGVLLVYWNAIDWLNLRVIRSQLGEGKIFLRDGEVVAFNGNVRTDSEPMTSPFTRTAIDMNMNRLDVKDRPGLERLKPKSFWPTVTGFSVSTVAGC